MKKVLLLTFLLCAGVCYAESKAGEWVGVPLQRAKGEITVARVGDLPSLWITFRTGDLAPTEIHIVKADGTRQTLSLKNVTDSFTSNKKTDGKTVSETMTLPDAAIRFDPFVVQHVRPYLRRYTDAQQQELADRWEQLPAASQHVFSLELRQTGESFEYYLDGNYIGRTVGTFEALIFNLSPAGDVLTAQAGTPLGDDRFLPIDMRWMARPGIFSNAVTSLQTGLQVVAGVPVMIATGADSGDIGQVCQNLDSLLYQL